MTRLRALWCLIPGHVWYRLRTEGLAQCRRCRATRPVDAIASPRRPDVTPDPGEALMPHARAVLDAIRAHPVGGPPTVSELAAVTGLTPAMVRQQVRILGRDGRLRRDPTALWGIEVDDSEGVAP